MKLYEIDHTRTNNFIDPDISVKIGAMWEKIPQISSLKNKTIYNIYTDYAGNYKDDYTCVLASEQPVEDVRILDTNHNQYRIFPVDDADVIGTWAIIWSLEEEGKLERTYTIDFEKYTPNGQIKIYIAIK